MPRNWESLGGILFGTASYAENNESDEEAKSKAATHCASDDGNLLYPLILRAVILARAG
jgi:hypothetical protein